MADLSPQAVAAARKALGIPDERIPRSVAIIMDGNGRWARAHALPRSAGHREGAKVVRKIVTEAARLGIEVLTLYSFSLDNWNRPSTEVNVLMGIYAEYLARERPTFMANNVRLRHVGRRAGLPESVLHELDETKRVSAGNTGMILCLALNYGARGEITDAVREIARQAAAGTLDPERIDESIIAANLSTAGVPDPDLVVRTSGEMRVSNFLLWQISYAEFYVTDIHWPDFDEAELHKAFFSYAARHRRFGGVNNSNL